MEANFATSLDLAGGEQFDDPSIHIHPFFHSSIHQLHHPVATVATVATRELIPTAEVINPPPPSSHGNNYCSSYGIANALRSISVKFHLHRRLDTGAVHLDVVHGRELCWQNQHRSAKSSDHRNRKQKVSKYRRSDCRIVKKRSVRL